MTTIAARCTPLAEPAADGREDGERASAVVTSLAEAEPHWRALERNGVLSPYGRFDWVAAFAAASPSVDVRVALGRDAAGQVELALPFAVQRRWGLQIGETVGGKHANYTVPTLRSAAAPKPERLRQLLTLAGRQIGLDAFAFINVPETWAGAPNPLAHRGRASASPAFSLVLDRTGEATLGRSMSNDARKKARNKTRGLAKLGRVTMLEASDDASADRILDAYFLQKRERFRELGIADPFADAGVRDFIRRASRGPEPAIELYALTLDDAVLATFGGAATRDRISGMFLSFAADPSHATSRYSPGDLLVHRVIERQCERGRSVFDLGVGEARYKRSVCDGLDPLVDVVIPISARGHGYAAALALAGAAKRRLKASPRAMATIAGARRRLARTG